NEIYQKLVPLLSLSIDEKADLVDTLKNEYSLYTVCRLIGLNHSTYLNRQKSKTMPKVLEADDAIFREQISAIFEQSGFRFGIKKIRAKMIQKGYMISERRISRIMKEAGIQPPKPLEKNATFRRQYRYYPNRLNRKFEQPQPNMAWVSDITYVRVADDVAYLCVVIDLFSRKVISHAVSEFIDTNLTSVAFQTAYALRGKPKDLIFHSDQGIQYTSYEFRQLLVDHSVQQSFSQPGNPLDNAVAESFFSSLKKEQFKFNLYANFHELEKSVEEYIHYYNSYRPHQTLKQKTPNEFEAEHIQCINIKEN
ncbi:MAG: IS3 family transposase, partial [Pygmaiobacter sp.]